MLLGLSTMGGERDYTIPKLSKYQQRCLAVAVKACEEFNATDRELAELLQITDYTLANWKDKHPDFAEAVSKAKAVADARVEAKLFERAVGYSYRAQKATQFKGEPVVIDYEEHIPPDVEAQKFWLKNRQPDKWSDKRDLNVGGDVTFQVVVGLKEEAPAIDVTPKRQLIDEA